MWALLLSIVLVVHYHYRLLLGWLVDRLLWRLLVANLLGRITLIPRCLIVGGLLRRINLVVALVVVRLIALGVVDLIPLSVFRLIDVWLHRFQKILSFIKTHLY